MNLPEARLRFTDCAVGYSGRTLIAPFSAEVAAGEVVVVLGRNGSGKSTLLRVAAGLIAPLAGTLEIVGAHSATERARKIAYVPQSPMSPEGYTVQDAVAISQDWSESRWSHSPITQQRVGHALSLLKINELASNRVDEISGGERQRVEIARAFAQNTSLVVMDEPASHLDVEHRGELGRLIRDQRTQGQAFLIAAHDVDWAAQVATKVWVIADRQCHICMSAQEAHEKGLLAEAYGVTFGKAGERFWDPEL